MQITPKVSIIVPVYKVEQYLPRCIESLLNQTLHEIEIILVDDGSPDNCPAICDTYAAKDSRIRVIHKQNGGLFRARHTGIEAATAKYVGAVDGDDFVSPDMFETLLQEAETHDSQMVCCSLVKYWSDDRQKCDGHSDSLTGFYSDHALENLIRNHLFDGTPHSGSCVIPSLCTKLIDRELIMSVYRDLHPSSFSITIGEDMLMSYSCLLRSQRVSVLGNFYPYFYAQHPTSMIKHYKKDQLLSVETLINNLYRMRMPDALSKDINLFLQRYGSFMVFNTIHRISSQNTPLRFRMREMIETVNYIHSSELWTRTLYPKADELFDYIFGRITYQAFLRKMPRSILFLDLVHQLILKIKRR